MKRAPGRSDIDAEIRVGWKMAGLGFEVGAQALAGALLGWLYDAWRGSGTTGVVVGASIGVVVGLWTLIKGSLKLNRQLDARHPTAGRGTPLPDDDPDEAEEGTDDDEPWTTQ